LSGAPAATVLVREVVVPRWPFRLGGGSRDGLLRRRGDGLVRLVHAPEPAVVAVAQRGPRVVFAARALTDAAARAGIARVRFALGVDEDLAEFYERFRDDPVIGRAVRARPELRVRRNPTRFEALMWAVAEQLIDGERATEIQKALIARLGRRWAGLRDSPSAAVVAAQAPALLEACGLAGKRALALRRAARVDLDLPDWRSRLLAIPEIGMWTVEIVALHGRGELGVIPAGDLGYLKLVGRLLTGHPKAVADEAEVRGFFSAYAPWAGLAGEYLRLTGGVAGTTAHRPAAATVVAVLPRAERSSPLRSGGHPAAYWGYVGGGRRPAAAGGARRNAS
jgi:DNA-3-methyladenine glycosylase II